MCASFAAHMKSLRLTSLAFLLTAAVISHAADSKDDSGKSKKKPAFG